MSNINTIDLSETIDNAGVTFYNPLGIKEYGLESSLYNYNNLTSTAINLNNRFKVDTSPNVSVATFDTMFNLNNYTLLIDIYQALLPNTTSSLYRKASSIELNLESSLDATARLGDNQPFYPTYQAFMQVIGDSLYIGYAYNNLIKLNLENYSYTSINTGGLSQISFVKNNKIYCLNHLNSSIYIIDPALNQIDTLVLDSQISSIADFGMLDNNRIVLLDGNNTLYILSTTNFSILHTLEHVYQFFIQELNGSTFVVIFTTDLHPQGQRMIYVNMDTDSAPDLTLDSRAIDNNFNYFRLKNDYLAVQDYTNTSVVDRIYDINNNLILTNTIPEISILHIDTSRDFLLAFIYPALSPYILSLSQFKNNKLISLVIN